MTAWYSISVTVAPEAAESIEYAFNSLDALGTEINHLQKKNVENITVIGYFNEMPDDERVQDELHYALRTYGLTESAVLQLERNTVAETDWLAEWKKHWRPTQIGRFVIAPPWIEVEGEDKVVIRIEPNMAFGTGTHETTQLCLQAIDAHYTPGDSFLDVGTGTGILAIAAAKLNLRSQISDLKPQRSDLRSQISHLKSQSSGLRSQISDLKLNGFDTDIDSIMIARENADLNGVRIDFHIGSISDETSKADFVCANLTLDVIKPILPLLIEKAGKTLVLSGILAEQEDEVVESLRELGVSNADIAKAGEWICLVIDNG
jgi:ribosomal protein L11 methyltransferase